MWIIIKINIFKQGVKNYCWLSYCNITAKFEIILTKNNKITYESIFYLKNSLKQICLNHARININN